MTRETLRDDSETRLGDTKKSIVLSEKVWCVYPWASVDWICLCFCVSLMMLVLRSVLFAENGRMGMENRQCLCRILMNKMELEQEADPRPVSSLLKGLFRWLLKYLNSILNKDRKIKLKTRIYLNRTKTEVSDRIDQCELTRSRSTTGFVLAQGTLQVASEVSQLDSQQRQENQIEDKDLS